MRVSRSVTSRSGFPLGTWVANRRHGKNPPDRVAALEVLPGWSWDLFEDDWRAAFELLGRYVQREGHARVPVGHLEEGFPLGRWVSKRRSAHRHGELSAERVDLLEGMPGWTWDARS